jgi:NTE family protein
MPATSFSPDEQRQGLALCLSGGGFRAALFHLGSLRRLNEAGVLAKITTITSVSGGSIASGLLAKLWRSFDFHNNVARNFADYETALRDFCSHDLRTAPLLWERLDPRDWPGLLSQDHSVTDFLAHAYEDRLVKGLRLGDLPVKGIQGEPKFIFCASNVQTGVNFELSGERIGDYQIGYAHAPEIPLSEAIAASSAFPIAFPALILKMDPARFAGGKLGNSALQNQLARRIVLSDGGVYDNLGLEPVWKTHATVLCSDGGKPFGISSDPGQAILPRLLRSQEVIGNQALALRKRWLMSSFENKLYDGTYWGIATEIDHYSQHGTGYLGAVLDRLREVRTDLNVFTPGEQLVLMNHGWALTDAALRSHASGIATSPLDPGQPPDERLLDNPAEALKALS